MNISTTLTKHAIFHRYSKLDIFNDEKYQAIWYTMKRTERPCFSEELLNEVIKFYANTCFQLDQKHIDTKYIILASQNQNIFNLGGDLAFFKDCVITKNREALTRYAKICVTAIYQNHTALNKDLTTISLVQGDALGGGFEAALASNIIIAEKSAKLGFPEIIFNLFPGMGAYNLLSRKIGHKLAEKMILSGQLYRAEELYDLGVIDVLCDDGQGELAVYETIAKENRVRNGITAFRKTLHLVNPVTYEELLQTTLIWVDAAMRLGEKDLKLMERLVHKQKERVKRAA